jgi:superfamily II RNA helicase
MVKLCLNKYPVENEEKYKEYFDTFYYPLSDFQKYSIESIIEGHHALICVPTGSGKTLPAEFAINYFTKLNKKVIYTSPIKALSNQKYYDFSKQYPNISFGLLTGDIKINPDADVVIMTAEILQNLIFMKSPNLSNVGAIIHDEVHYINNTERGYVWESILMSLSHNIQNVMLSATLDHPEKFAEWVEKLNPTSGKQVYLTTLKERVVPLTHQTFITCNQSLLKLIKDKELEKQIRDIIDKPITIQTSKGIFDEKHYYKMKKILDIFGQKKLFVKRSFILNKVCQYMVDNNLLPAVCFILSRKQIEIAAREITTVLLEDDSKIPYTVRRECEQILRNKLPNFEEYIQLPEYISMMSLLEKGIATHHSGTLPVLKEIVELLFCKGYIKLLFATETFSCGLNMPIKTTIFTDVNKFDGKDVRILYGHEYNQMSGRAGRRGIDAIGTVIHLNNLFKTVNLTDYKLMLQGKPQMLISKFKISYNLILNTILQGKTQTEDIITDNNIVQKFVEKSMLQIDIESQISSMKKELLEKENQLANMHIDNIKTPEDIVNRYIFCLVEVKISINKKRREYEKEIQLLQDEYKMIENDVKIITSYNDKKREIKDIEELLLINDGYLNTNIKKMLNLMISNGILIDEFTLSDIGKISSQLKEVPCLVIGKMIGNNKFSQYSAKQLTCIFSCLSVIGKENESGSGSDNEKKKEYGINGIINEIKTEYMVYEDFEINNYIDTGVEYYLNDAFIEYVSEWYDSQSGEECMNVIKKIEQDKGVFLGEFVKCIIKINNISNEIEKIAESIGDISLLDKIKDIHLNTLKFVATNQSLYI